MPSISLPSLTATTSLVTHIGCEYVVPLNDAGFPLAGQLQLLPRRPGLLLDVDDVVGVHQQDRGVVGEPGKAGLRFLRFKHSASAHTGMH